MKKTILLTGATSGIGRAAAVEFYKQGFEIIIPARNKQKIDDLISETSKYENGVIKHYECDLASQKSLKKFVENVKNDYSKIDILINNAGIWNPKLRITDEDIEETFAVNIFASYFLTQEFLPLIEKGELKRIVYTSSGLHGGTINFDDIQFRKKYTSYLVYQQSKLALILLTTYFAKQLKEKEITVNCFHPGFVSTSLGASHTKFSKMFFNLFGKSSEKGAETLIYLTLNDEVENVSGEYFAKKKIVKTQAYSKDFEIAKKMVDEIEKFRI